MPQTVVLQIVSNGMLEKGKDPEFWKGYKAKVLQEITQGAMDTVRNAAARLWAHPSAGGIDQSWHMSVGENVGTFWNSKPYAYWLNYGVRPHKMRYLLLNNKGVYYLSDGTPAATIRMVSRETGEVTFRTITGKHLTESPAGPPWWHPGLPAQNFLEHGLQEYADFKLRKDLKGITVRILRKGGL